MVYESEFYTRRPYTSTYTSSSRPTISSYTLTSSYDRDFDDDITTPTYYNSPSYLPSYRYYSPLSVIPAYQRVGGFNRPSFKFAYDDDYPTEIGYSSVRRTIPIPMTRITTSPMRVYRERVSPVRVITPSARIYRRDAYSPVRVITSPSRVVSVRVRPSVLSREFDRIERKHRMSPIGFDATDEWLNSPYTSTFNDETRDIRAQTKRLLREVNEPVQRAPSVPRYTRALSAQPKSYSRFDRDSVPDKYGDQQIENEFYVNKNILRPTRKTRDQIEILSTLKYRELPKRYSGISHLATARIVGDVPYYSRRSLAHEFDPLDYSVDRVRNDVYYLSYYAKNRDAVAADAKKGKRDDDFESSVNKDKNLNKNTT
ncbi:hypothetical protein ACKWTF_012390 [Chironomus riparius]